MSAYTISNKSPSEIWLLNKPLGCGLGGDPPGDVWISLATGDQHTVVSEVDDLSLIIVSFDDPLTSSAPAVYGWTVAPQNEVDIFGRD
jgi:hypothetical protein